MNKWFRPIQRLFTYGFDPVGSGDSDPKEKSGNEKEFSMLNTELRFQEKTHHPNPFIIQ